MTLTAAKDTDPPPPDPSANSATPIMMTVEADPTMGTQDNPLHPKVTPSWLAIELSDEKNLLVLDTRGPQEFADCHIQTAIHVTIPSLMLKRLKKGNLSVDCVIKCEKFISCWRTHRIVLYDEAGEDLDGTTNSLLGLLYLRLVAAGCNVLVLKGGYTEFQSQFAELCDGQIDAEEPGILGLRSLQIADSQPAEEDVPSPTSSTRFPVEVLPHLFLGNAKNSADQGCLSRNGIRYILNVTNNIPNTFEHDNNYRYMKIPINDHWSQNLAASFPEAIAFIDEAREKGCGVLVHCLAGISRSVTVTVAYLMFKNHLTLNDAYDVVKKCKPNISPNFNFLGQLLDFERTIHAVPCECKEGVGRDSPDQLMLPTSVELRACKCRKETRTFFSSPTCTSSSVSSTSSMSSSSSLAMSSASSSTAFDYDISPTPH